jgi:DNA-directed RNA polymerase subunit RPC12/RpoP
MSFIIPCPGCRKELVSQTSIKGKPYFVCSGCGVQVFFRLKEGIDKLKVKAPGGKKKGVESNDVRAS